MLYSSRVGGTGDGIFTVSIDNGRPSECAPPAFAGTESSLSPDGNLLAYISSESGTPELWMRAFPVPQDKRNLSRVAVRGPRRTPDGPAA